MKLPTLSAVAEEAFVRIAGAILAAYIVGQLPPVKRWLQNQWLTN